MPSPFPGMDPYLEGSLWTTVHAQLAAEIARQLAPRLRPKYLALTAERFVFEDPDDVTIATRSTYPDVGVARTTAEVPLARGEGIEIAPAPHRLATVVPLSVPHFNVEIRDRDRRELVTAIEILSPTNKRGEGRQEYLQKRRHLLMSTAHLMEIDLLRHGTRPPMRQPLPPASYYVLLSRSTQRPDTDVWPIRISEPLPVVPVPLLPGDADVPLDLHAALASIYDLLGYDLAVDYARPPEVALVGDEAAWAEERLRASGHRH